MDTQIPRTTMIRSLALARLRSHLTVSRMVQPPLRLHALSTQAKDSLNEPVMVSQTKAAAKPPSSNVLDAKDDEKVLTSACGDLNEDDDDEDEMEEMFVDADESFGHQMREWGGPRRGGRFLEPTRFGDWERKGRCSDF